MLQDANYNIVGLLNNSGSLLHQYTYSPYGRLINSEEFKSCPLNYVGHQGLFFENFLDEGLSIDNIGLYYNRNRWYNPTLGRFIQKDLYREICRKKLEIKQ